MAPGAWFFLGFIVVIVVALVLTAYTRRGSGIEEHPVDARGSAPGARGPTEFAGRGEELPDNTGTR